MEILKYRYLPGKVCSRCVMDETVKGITFDDSGTCTFCQIHDELEKEFGNPELNSLNLNRLVERIKKDGKNKPYDCIVGVSGGRDSTYTLYSAVKLGLRPLAVHFDNGWNTELSVQNIKNACTKLNVDLYTHVANWEEFKDLQRAFLKSSTSDAEVPTDWVIFSVLYQQASKNGVKYIIHGHSFRTEGTTPLTWTYMDGKYVKYIHERFGRRPLKSFPVMYLSDYLYYTFFKGIRQIRLLYYLPYDEKEILSKLKSELDWKDYGGKHHESTYTAFFQSYILPRKFNIDKRKLHYSALIRSGQMSRADAINKLQIDPYTGGQQMIEYCLKKLDFTHDEFINIMNTPVKSFMDYKSYYPYVKFFKQPIRIATRLGIIPGTVYRKYFLFQI
ncbi:MAG: N-acetyl sugar amidotransferase [Firmicutes bacterium]|nr:N-acetyl sugar amidotransferase [Bacillota bacterium]